VFQTHKSYAIITDRLISFSGFQGSCVIADDHEKRNNFRSIEEAKMDALELAINMEKDAITFYTEAARKTKYPAGKKMFQTIAEDEKRHLEMVAQIIKGLKLTHQNASPMKNVKTIFESMKNEMMKKVEATADELEAFKIAMRMEKEGLEFYKKTLAGSKKEPERILLEMLIKEEQQHYDIFANTYQFLSDSGNWFMWEERGIVEG
jgi:rubrerythrin